MLTLDITCKLIHHILYLPYLYTIDIYYLIPLSVSGLDVGLGSQCQQKTNHGVLIFSYTSQLIRMKSDVVLKQLKLNILILLQRERVLLVCFF